MKKIAVLLALAFLPTLASANLVVNGSFEADAQGANSWNIYSGLTGWTGGSSGIELRNNVAGAASDGVNFVELDTRSNSEMFQVISTSSGTWYDLTFDYSPREGVSAVSNPIQVWWNSTLLTAPAITGVGGSSGNNWSPYTFSVLGTGSDTLKFNAFGTSDSYGGSLDKVSLTAAVPEPETYGMMLMGLGLMGFIARRRKNGQA